MTRDLVHGLRALAEALPAGTAVPVPRELLLELLADGGAAEVAPAIAPADLTVAEVAARFGRQRSTVRGWLERGDFPGAYRLHGREWRIPAAALASFEAAARRPPGADREPAARLPAGRQAVNLGAWRTAS
jgi:excisionase family DNA binding protein